jgi:hypothetical protein
MNPWWRWGALERKDGIVVFAYTLVYLYYA